MSDPRDAPPLRWGVLAAGGIAGRFTDAVLAGTRSQVVAVGSRDRGRAERFAVAHGVPRAHASYRALVEDPQVEAVYVASPHSEHAEHALLAIGAGKHVLVEKAFARNLPEARRVLAAAREAGVFVMEAMKPRFLPYVAELHRLLADGAIGEVVHVRADFGALMPDDPAGRLYSPALAGGALLDLGVYPVSFAHDLLGVPERVTAVGRLTQTGVDGQVSALLAYPRAQAVASATLWAQTSVAAEISGTEGTVVVPPRFTIATSFRLTRRDGSAWTFAQPGADPFAYEAAEVARRVAAGETESPRMTWQGTLDVMATLDEARRQLGVVYPGERPSSVPAATLAP